MVLKTNPIVGFLQMRALVRNKCLFLYIQNVLCLCINISFPDPKEFPLNYGIKLKGAAACMDE